MRLCTSATRTRPVSLEVDEKIAAETLGFGWRFWFEPEPDGTYTAVAGDHDTGEVLRTSHGDSFGDAYLQLGVNVKAPASCNSGGADKKEASPSCQIRSFQTAGHPRMVHIRANQVSGSGSACVSLRCPTDDRSAPPASPRFRATSASLLTPGSVTIRACSGTTRRTRRSRLLGNDAAQIESTVFTGIGKGRGRSRYRVRDGGAESRLSILRSLGSPPRAQKQNPWGDAGRKAIERPGATPPGRVDATASVYASTLATRDTPPIGANPKKALRRSTCHVRSSARHPTNAEQARGCAGTDVRDAAGVHARQDRASAGSLARSPAWRCTPRLQQRAYDRVGELRAIRFACSSSGTGKKGVEGQRRRPLLGQGRSRGTVRGRRDGDNARGSEHLAEPRVGPFSPRRRLTPIGSTGRPARSPRRASLFGKARAREVLGRAGL
jgi:hypothetical protein